MRCVKCLLGIDLFLVEVLAPQELEDVLAGNGVLVNCWPSKIHFGQLVDELDLSIRTHCFFRLRDHGLHLVNWSRSFGLAGAGSIL